MTKEVKCDTCSGTGKVPIGQGYQADTRPCSACKGTEQKELPEWQKPWPGYGFR